MQTWRRKHGLDGQAQPRPGLQHGRRPTELASGVGGDGGMRRTRAVAVQGRDGKRTTTSPSACASPTNTRRRRPPIWIWAPGRRLVELLQVEVRPIGLGHRHNWSACRGWGGSEGGGVDGALSMAARRGGRWWRVASGSRKKR